MAKAKSKGGRVRDMAREQQNDARTACEARLDSYEADFKAGRLGIKTALALACMAGAEFQAKAPSGARAR